MHKIFTLREQGDVFVDALACDDNGQLLFMSAYGRDTSVQQLLSRLHLRSTQDGIDHIHLVDPSSSRVVLEALVGDPARFPPSITGRMPKGNLFGNLVQVWVFDGAVLEPDRPNQRGWLLLDRDHGPEFELTAIWSLVQKLSPLPLLDTWRDRVLALLGDAYIRRPPAIGPIKPIKVCFPDHFVTAISEMVVSGALALDDTHTGLQKAA